MLIEKFLNSTELKKAETFHIQKLINIIILK